VQPVAKEQLHQLQLSHAGIVGPTQVLATWPGGILLLNWETKAAGSSAEEDSPRTGGKMLMWPCCFGSILFA